MTSISEEVVRRAMALLVGGTRQNAGFWDEMICVDGSLGLAAGRGSGGAEEDSNKPPTTTFRLFPGSSRIEDPVLQAPSDRQSIQ